MKLIKIMFKLLSLRQVKPCCFFFTYTNLLKHCINKLCVQSLECLNVKADDALIKHCALR